MPNGKNGRPKVQIDFNTLDGILQFSATKQMCADILECTVDVIERRVLEEKGVNFSTYKAQKMSKTKLKLQQRAITEALAGNNVMLIFSLKNLCMWRDKIEVTEIDYDDMEFKDDG